MAAVPLIVGGVWSVIQSFNNANHAKMVYDEQVSLVCAQTALKTNPSMGKYSDAPSGFFAEDERIDPTKLGCSNSAGTPTAREIFDATPPGDFNYAVSLLHSLSVLLAVTLAVSLFVYGVTRAIGWVIGGFAAS